MSAYLVEDKCINEIATYFSGPRHDWEQSTIEEALRQQGTIGEGFAEKLANAMYELNCNSLTARYGDEEFAQFTFRRSFCDSSYAIYDRLGEWLYQCAEGDIPEASKFFQAMQRVYDQMAHRFFRDLRDRETKRRNGAA
jgi:hypothetical protein